MTPTNVTLSFKCSLRLPEWWPRLKLEAPSVMTRTTFDSPLAWASLAYPCELAATVTALWPQHVLLLCCLPPLARCCSILSGCVQEALRS